METSSRKNTAELIVAGARERGLEVRDFSHLFDGFYQLRSGDHRELIYYCGTDGQGHITYRVCALKPLTDELLRQGGFPTPADRVVGSPAEAAQFLTEYKKIVIKPLNGTGGAGITPGITREADLAAAFSKAQTNNESKEDQRVLCQEHVEGRDFRLLVIDQQHVMAMERVPAYVTGDGQQTIRELVGERNQTKPEPYHIRLEEGAFSLLQEAGMFLDSVPEAGQAVRLAGVANAHAGGFVRDVTDRVHPDVHKLVCRVAEYFKMPVVGVDWIASNIDQPEGFIIELNATPDFTIHYYPDEGVSRNPVGPFLDMLFPETKTR